jgi:predicted Fe-Mo cluster-binding NifX family protein
MKVGIVLEDDKGLDSNVSAHFGHCPFFLLAEIDPDKKEMLATHIVPNNAQHGGGGCVAVDEILKHKITHVIAGGMGMGAQQKFVNAGVKVFGYDGSVKDALSDFMRNTLGGIEACREHEHGEGCH